MARHPRAPWAAVSIAILFAACSSTALSSRDGGGDAPPAVDAVADVAVDSPAPPTSPCPRDAPSDGSTCSREALECEYGADPRRECRDVAVCAAGVWRVQTPASGGMSRPWCASVPPAACPATLDAASGQRCPAQGAVCTYGGLVCQCTNCLSFPVPSCGGDPRWQCDRQPSASGCPAASARFGELCTQEGINCEYGCNSPDGAVMCRGGVWQRGRFENCPMSSRAVKRDIAYVTDAEADALAAQVRATRLATYEYTVPAMAGRRRLGFILEDQPNSYAADPERSQVDLYGYTSLLVATVQAQDRQIRALTRRIEGLERRLAAPRRTRR